LSQTYPSRFDAYACVPQSHLGVLQCVAVCCSVLKYPAHFDVYVCVPQIHLGVLRCVAAMCCSDVLQYIAVHYSVCLGLISTSILKAPQTHKHNVHTHCKTELPIAQVSAVKIVSESQNVTNASTVFTTLNHTASTLTARQRFQ